MKNLAGLMKQASQMQAKMQEMQEKLEATEVEGEAGAGMVRVTLSGKAEMKRLKLDPKLLDPSEAEMLEDLIVAALNEAGRRADESLQSGLSGMLGGLNLPGF